LSPLALSLRFLQTQSDARLADLARAGHERAFEALVRRYRRELLAYCRRVGSVGTNAEDTLQQALLQAWSALSTGIEVRDPRAWLYRIVHNVAVSNQRRPVVVPVEVRETAGTRGADQEAEQRMAARDALAGLAALPDLQR
jgi:DNA-directed RNA polymerase specialized sigma24 family protein